MFGRVIVNKPELKFCEFDTYRAHYCGLCRGLKEAGYLSALSLNYDMTFLSLLLNSLYEPQLTTNKRRCACHILKPHDEATDKFTPYICDMTILLSYYKCLDDFADEKNIIKLLYAAYLKPHVKKITKKYPEKCNSIKNNLNELSVLEKSGSLEECANLFGNLLGEVFTPENDLWSDELHAMGFYLGKFIYIADAYEDICEDIKKNRPNPLIEMYSAPDFDKECNIILNMMAAECAAEFEKLPLEQNVEILRNILYSGIWQSIEGDRK